MRTRCLVGIFGITAGNGLGERAVFTERGLNTVLAHEIGIALPQQAHGHEDRIQRTHQKPVVRRLIDDAMKAPVVLGDALDVVLKALLFGRQLQQFRHLELGGMAGGKTGRRAL